MSTELSVEDVARLLGVSKQRVTSICRDGLLECRRIGRTWLIDSDSVARYRVATANRSATDHKAHLGKSKKPVALSFFSGAMGLDQGIEKAGFDIRLACEVDRYCRRTIELNRPNMALIGDINNYSADEVLRFAGLNRDDDVDLIFGGPPCQAFSTAGKRNGFSDDRGNVFLKYLEIAFDIRPKFIVIENVRGLLSCPMSHRPHQLRGPEFPDLSLDELPGGALNFVLSLINIAGYKFSFNLYNAANFGTPQIRERVVIVCSRDGERPSYLVPTHSEFGDDGRLTWTTFREATQGLEVHHHINFPEKRLAYYRLLKDGQYWKHLPVELQKEALGKSYFSGGGKTGFLRRLAWDKPSPTLVTHPAMPATDLAHPSEDRPLSIQEYKRLQEFSDDWELAGPITEQYKQVGNAVPVSLGFAIGRLIRSLLQSEKVVSPPAFKYSRYKFTSDQDWLLQFKSRSAPKKAEVNRMLPF